MQFIQRTIPDSFYQRLVEEGTSPILARLFAGRGIQSKAEVSTDLRNLIPPSALKGCVEAASYLADAIATNKKLLIVADYDCDGATACAVGIRGIEELGKPYQTKVDFIVPNRFTMGYGLTPEVVDLALARSEKPDILITVDNGIASITGVEYAISKGLDVLITDHHLPADEIPNATHIVNPNQPGCDFRSKALAGVGVMFYLLLALRAELRSRNLFTVESQPKIEKLLDLVALGTVADVASLDQNNRILVAAGLRRIRQLQVQPGIAALFEVSSREPLKANTFDLGFGIGPRLNAAGRLADMTLGIQCLLSNDVYEAKQLAIQLDRINRERRNIEDAMKETALDVMSDIDTTTQYGLTLFNPDWHQGVIGILASRLKEKYHRPILVFAKAEEVLPDGTAILKGSGRSIAGFHLRDALDIISKRHPSWILKFGGHAMAAGLSIPKSVFPEFAIEFNEVAQKNLNLDLLNQKIIHDGDLPYEYIDPTLASQLSDEVWGQGFPEPIFTGTFRVVKQSILKEKHLKVELMPLEGSRKSPFLGIWFSHADYVSDEITIAYRLLVDHYLGYPRAQLHIEAIVV